MIDEKQVDYIRDDLNKMVANQLSRGLLSQAGADLIGRVINAEAASDEDGIKVGRIGMPVHGGAHLKRLFVIRGEDGQHILYVPEQPKSPGDRLFYENYDLRRTGHVLVGFMGKPGGLDYMLDLVPEDKLPFVKNYFEEVSRLPSQWSETSIIIMPVPGKTYLHQIQKIVNR
jgi:hypothetical protein